MALIICKECNKEVSNQAKTCPNCGAKIKKSGIGCLGIIGLFFLGFIALGVIANIVNPKPKVNVTDTNQVTQTSAPKNEIYKEGQNLKFGYMSYKVLNSYYTNKLSNKSYDTLKPDGIYLVVNLELENTSKDSIILPPFKLVDLEGAEYSTTAHAWHLRNNVGHLSSLNPNLKKSGVVAFDVPTNKKFRIKLSGGYLSGVSSLVELNPKKQ